MEEETNTEKVNEPESEVISMQTDIHDLPFSSRTKWLLKQSSIRTIGGLITKRADDILCIEGLGPKTIGDIQAVLKELGLSLKDTANPATTLKVWKFCPHCGNKLI